jgi:hypothetical protein
MDDAANKAARDLALILKCWLDGDRDALVRLMVTPEGEHAILLQSLALNVWYLSRTDNPSAVFDVLLRDDPLQKAQVQVSETQRARHFLRTHLADGPVSIADLKRVNDASPDPLRWKAVDNAAAALKVVRRGHPGDRGSMWSLPSSKSSPQSKPR